MDEKKNLQDEFLNLKQKSKEIQINFDNLLRIKEDNVKFYSQKEEIQQRSQNENIMLLKRDLKNFEIKDFENKNLISEYVAQIENLENLRNNLVSDNLNLEKKMSEKFTENELKTAELLK